MHLQQSHKLKAIVVYYWFSRLRIVSTIYVLPTSYKNRQRFPTVKDTSVRMNEEEEYSRSTRVIRYIFILAVMVLFNAIFVLVASSDLGLLISIDLLLICCFWPLATIFNESLDKELALLSLRFYKSMIRYGLIEEIYVD